MPIDLYIVRHGLAGEHGSYADDEKRPLTDEGQRKTKQIANRLESFGIRFDSILTSPLVRARQTADIFVAAGLGKTLEESRLLAPEGHIQDWLPWFETWKQSGSECLALVGHEPNLSTWAEQLVWGEIRYHIRLKKAGVIGITLPKTGSPIGQGELFWLTPPRFLMD
ncbi:MULTISPECIES: phosphohistidine phosphatase SixA [unclassified Leptolyngbya]|uniref:phosphohistidine phosphatase SixA n=1 Tax=unclassified Leptolyngbya TaxID=2650499 RepID=UPI001688FD87|nr:MULTISPECIES: phosphohistidine phosphatase SixA [unclassified Leptolyngbya]MBD1910871.1 phosphohistidine phosphatase SixA [Leptolyngbya sp. FACHB-8]MBD2153734.1 phosphohistidine phosphatase SixA [Leptolyngbya sp. FACHB-16]